MENASKALLIAGAILIAIVLISLGVMILGQGSDLVKNANMSDAEITTYNSEFEQYVGGNIRGNLVRQMIDKVNQHNRSNSDDKSKQIIVASANTKLTESDLGNPVNNDNAAINVIGKNTILTGNSYTVQAQYSSGGLISKITVVKN